MFKSLATISFILTFFATASLQAAIPTPAPPKVAGTGHLLIDFDSGHIISEDNANARLEPASLTKLMTAHVVFHELKSGNLKLDDEAVISEKAWKTGGSKMFIEVGKKVKIRDLLKGMIIQSGNDASIALAEHIAGSESVFASMMNTQAQKLGMLNTNFVNSSGLPHPDHYTTAEDMAKVAMATIRDFPEYYPWYSEKDFEFNGIRQSNRNKLLWKDKSVDGLKTGHTEAAGYCLVSSAKRDGMRLVSVVMGTNSMKSREEESLKLLNYGFRFYETHKLYSAGDTLSTAKVWKGESDKLPVGIKDDLFITIPRNKYDKLEASIQLNSQITAPISESQQVGSLVITLSGDSVTEKPLVALNSIAEGGFFGKLIDNVMMMLE